MASQELQMLERRMDDRFEQIRFHLRDLDRAQAQQQRAQLEQQQAQLQQQQTQFQQQQTQIQQLQAQLQELREGMSGMRAELDLQPMRLHNSAISFMDTFIGPNFGPIPNDHPNNRDALVVATAQQCIAFSQYLGLPALPDNATGQQRKGQIARFLGVVGFPMP